jgi:hypothetical protein
MERIAWPAGLTLPVIRAAIGRALAKHHAGLTGV